MGEMNERCIDGGEVQVEDEGMFGGKEKRLIEGSDRMTAVWRIKKKLHC